jgi:hypothetical protein
MGAGVPAIGDVLEPVVSALAPKASPPPAPRRRRGFLGNGPVTFGARGGIDVGTQRSTRDATTQAGTQYGGALTVSLERRTERATALVSQGLGYNAGSGSLAQLQVGYRTPGYALDYGQIAGPQQTQLAIGGFVRGVRLSRPRTDGAIEFLLAAAMGGEGQGFTAYGARWTKTSSRSQTAVTALRAVGQHGGASNAILALDYQRYRASGTSVFEAALSRPTGLLDLADGAHAAFALSHQVAGRWGYAELRLRDVPSGFASLNGVTLPAREANLTLRRDLGLASVGFSLNRLSVTQVTGIDSSDRVTTDLSRGWQHGSLALTASLSTDAFAGTQQVSRSLGLALSQTIGRQTALSETVQSSSIATDIGMSRVSGASLGMSRQLGGGFLQLSLGGGKTLAPDSLSTYLDELVSYTRPIGRRLDLNTALGENVQTQNGIWARIDSASLGLIARLSSALALRVALSENLSRGATTSRGSTLQVDLTGPLAFGSAARAEGHGDPRFPGTIRGHVYVVGGADLTAAAAQQSGYGNVLVVLDNTQTQRTDATGEFDFAFVKAGMHTVAIEPASLPAGFIPDRRSDTINVVGGGIVGIDFGVGRFAGVGGRVFANGPGGPSGIPGLIVVVDGQQRTVTDERGRWSIGRLTPGTHRVALSQEGIPSNVAFTGASEKVVQVVDGAITPVDFVALSLGSIAGTVVTVDPNDPSLAKGVPDVYVVAQPGDHAGITSADGSFILDDLPPGRYTLDVDKDTVPDGLGAAVEPADQPLAPSQHVDGIVLKLGQEEKGVVFTFKGGKRSALVLAVDPQRVPPGGLVTVTVRGDGSVKGPVGLESDLFRSRVPLKEDGANVWTASFVIPAGARGEVPLEALAANGSASNAVTVDGAMQLLTLRTIPVHPRPGGPVHLTLRSYAPLREGDVVRFEDGQSVRLPKPHGRSFELDVRLWARGLPYSATVTARGVSYPFGVR